MDGAVDGAERTGRGPRAPVLGALVLSAVLLVVGGALVRLSLEGTAAGIDAAPLLLLLLAFAVSEVVVVHTHVGRQVLSTSLTDIPLVVGLFVVDPLTLVLARVVGPALVHVLHRRSPLLKVAFNGTVSLLDVALVVSVLGLLLPSGEPLTAADPTVWAAVYLAASGSAVVQVVAVGAVIVLHEGRTGARGLLRECALGVVTTLVLASLALVAVAGVQSDPRFGWLVGVAALVLVLVHRSYVRLWYRHQSMERLVRFTTTLRADAGDEHTWQAVLERARDLLLAEEAHILLLTPGEEPGLTVSVSREGTLHRRAGTSLPEEWVADVLTGHRTALLVSGGTDDPVGRAWLSEQSLREAVVVPVSAEGAVLAVLWVGDRLSDVRAFDEDDLTLLASVAGQVGLALQNGRLRDDIELHQRTREKLARLAEHDDLTGLANRRQLERHLGAVLSSVPQDVVLLYGDLDGFKPVNDRHGHGVGDEVLVHVAGRLLAGAGPTGFVARVGGDEFVVVRTDLVGEAAADGLAARLAGEVARPVPTSVGPLEVGMSLGTARGGPGVDPHELMAAADAAMYARKRGVRGRPPQPSEAR